MRRFDRALRPCLALLALSLIACSSSDPGEISYAELKDRVADLSEEELLQTREACQAELDQAKAELARLKEQFEEIPVAEVQSARGRSIREGSAAATQRLQELRACLNLLRREDERRKRASAVP